MEEKNIMNDLVLQKSTEFMLLNVYSLPQMGFVYGKAGIALTLFELSGFKNEEAYEEYAYDLLKEVLTYKLENKNFAYGTAGIGYVLDYLIKNRFLDADYQELFGKQHQEILDEILYNLEDTQYDKYHYADFLFWVESLAEHIDEEMLESCEYVLTLHILNALVWFESSRKLSPSGISVFYDYASKLLAVCNSCRVPDKCSNRFIVKIKHVLERLCANDIICSEPLLGFQLYIYGVSRNQDELVEIGKKMIDRAIKDLYPSILNFKQKIDLAYHMLRVYHLDRTLDYRYKAKELMNILKEEKVEVFEGKLMKAICSGVLPNLGCGQGLCRLLLLNIFWDKMEQGEWPDHITELLN